jgi:hypothetical protein
MIKPKTPEKYPKKAIFLIFDKAPEHIRAIYRHEKQHF